MNVSGIRKDFPTVGDGKPIYLDSACQTLKPKCVIDKILEYYTEYPACGGRSIHAMATKVSMEVDDSRAEFVDFFNAGGRGNIVFTKNCTESINIVAHGFGLRAGDAVLTSDSEHNSNNVPWMAMSDMGVRRRVFATDDSGDFNLDAFADSIKGDVRLVSVCHASNVTGRVFPIKEITEIAHDAGVSVCVDGAQAASHMGVDLTDLDVDFYCVSAHKMMGPTGVGVLYGKEESLRDLKPLSYGGGAVASIGDGSFELPPAPEKFEAGSGNYSGIIGAAEAVRYLRKIGMDNIEKHTLGLQRKISEALPGLGSVKVVGSVNPEERGAVFSFNVSGMMSHDVAMVMDSKGVMIRSGMHCSHPFFEKTGIDGCARASFQIYNDESDIEKFLSLLEGMAKR